MNELDTSFTSFKKKDIHDTWMVIFPPPSAYGDKVQGNQLTGLRFAS